MKLSRIIQHASLGLLVLVGLSGALVTAAGTGKTTVKPVSGNGQLQNYASDSVLQPGTIVQLDGKDSKKVKPASSKALDDMYGVTVDPHLLSLTVADSGLQNQVYVANSGTYEVLVSNQAGTIKKGDYVAMSAVDGVGMKAAVKDRLVFGKAEGGFDGKATALGNATLKNTDGSSHGTVTLGLVRVSIDIQKNPLQIPTKADLPSFLQKIGQDIAQKQVSPVRIYISIFVTGLSIIIALVTLYAGIRNAMIAIGRNPLSKKSIFRGLLEVILTGFLILIIGLFAVYLLLKL